MELNWSKAPLKTEWGDMMMQAHIALTNDNTLSLYCEKEMTNVVDALLQPTFALDESTICITKQEYEEMQDEILFLECLRSAGVDNWDGYDYAIDEYHQSREED